MEFETSMSVSPTIMTTPMIITILLFSIIGIVSMWKLFDKAGEKPWKCLIPFYNTFVLVKIATGKAWLAIFMFIPIANIVMAFMIPFKLGSAFGKGIGFKLGLLFLFPIFVLILAFGNNEYQGVK